MNAVNSGAVPECAQRYFAVVKQHDNKLNLRLDGLDSIECRALGPVERLSETPGGGGQV